MDQVDRRLSERIRATLGQVFEQEISDPRLRHVTITDVRAHTDADIAKVFYSAVDPSIVTGQAGEGDKLADAEDVQAGLDAAAGHLRHQLAERLDLRRTPKLIFAVDPVPEQSSKVDELIRNLHAND